MVFITCMFADHVREVRYAFSRRFKWVYVVVVYNAPTNIQNTSFNIIQKGRNYSRKFLLKQNHELKVS